MLPATERIAVSRPARCRLHAVLRGASVGPVASVRSLHRPPRTQQRSQRREDVAAIRQRLSRAGDSTAAFTSSALAKSGTPKHRPRPLSLHESHRAARASAGRNPTAFQISATPHGPELRRRRRGRTTPPRGGRLSPAFAAITALVPPGPMSLMTVTIRWTKRRKAVFMLCQH